MKLLITARQAAEAFGKNSAALEGLIDDGIIMSAQQKFIKPILGSLYGALEADVYPRLLEDHVKPALAQWVKYLLLPSVSAQAGPAGVVQYEGEGMRRAGDTSLARLTRRARNNAEALTRSLIEHIESQPELYPEYVQKENVRNTVNITGGVIL